MTTTVNLLPTGDGASTGWIAFGETNRWECVDDPVATPDDLTTYLQSAPGERDSVTIASSSTSGIIDSITVHGRISRPSGVGPTNVKLFVRVDGTNYDGDLISSSSTDFANFTQTWAANPATGQSWTNAILTGTQIGVSFVSGNAAFITQIYLSVIYSVCHQINGGTYIPGVNANWQRQAKRTNDDGSVDWLDYALLTWDISQATMIVYEELRAVQGRVLPSLVTTDIDNRNEPRLYSDAEVKSVVPVQQIGRRATGLRVEFMVKI